MFSLLSISKNEHKLAQRITDSGLTSVIRRIRQEVERLEYLPKSVLVEIVSATADSGPPVVELAAYDYSSVWQT